MAWQKIGVESGEARLLLDALLLQQTAIIGRRAQRSNCKSSQMH